MLRLYGFVGTMLHRYLHKYYVGARVDSISTLFFFQKPTIYTLKVNRTRLHHFHDLNFSKNILFRRLNRERVISQPLITERFETQNNRIQIANVAAFTKKEKLQLCRHDRLANRFSSPKYYKTLSPESFRCTENMRK